MEIASIFIKKYRAIKIGAGYVSTSVSRIYKQNQNISNNK